jgi:hypothetical protein
MSFTKLKEYLLKNKNNIIHDDICLLGKINRGLYTSDYFKKNSIIFEIDISYMISKTNLDKLPYIECYRNNIKCLSSLFALYLILNETNYHEYIDMLPTNLDNFWYYIDKEDKLIIEETYIGKKISKYEMEFMEDYNIIKKYFPDLEKEKYIKFKLLVLSRLFSYQNNKKKEISLVPLVDLINHSNNNNCIWYYDSKINKFCVKTIKNVNRGEELLFSYGDNKNNTLSFLLYGFLMNENTNDILLTINNMEIIFDSELEIDYKVKKECKDRWKQLNLIKNKINNENILRFIKFEMEIINKCIR